MTIEELITILHTLQPKAKVVTLDSKGKSCVPRVHITNYLNVKEQEVVIDYE